MITRVDRARRKIGYPKVIRVGKDRDGREIVVMFVQGKGKSRKLVAPKSVGEYLDRVRELSKATAPDDAVFTIINGKPAKYLYSDTVQALLEEADLRMGPNGIPRSTYCFRHTYATFRLREGVDVYILSEQMGTSVKMIENHYGHVNTIKHADRVLMGIGGWEATRIRFLIDKTRLLDRLRGQINERQEKALLRLFREGPDGFAGGLSAGNYRTITGASLATATRDLNDLTLLWQICNFGIPFRADR